MAHLPASRLASFLRSTSPPPVPQLGAWWASRKEGAAEQGRGDGELGGDVVAGGGGTLPGFLGRKNRYARVDGVLLQESQDGGGIRVRGRGDSCWRYVFSCSVFASLDHVLLGYGEQISTGSLEWRFVLDANLVLLIELRMTVAFTFFGGLFKQANKIYNGLILDKKTYVILL